MADNKQEQQRNTTDVENDLGDEQKLSAHKKKQASDSQERDDQPHAAEEGISPGYAKDCAAEREEAEEVEEHGWEHPSA